MPDAQQPPQLTIVTNRRGVETTEVQPPAQKAKIAVGDYQAVYLKRVAEMLAAREAERAAQGG